MNDWHSIRFLLIGAVATIVVASSATYLFKLHMHLTTDRAMHSKTARAFKEKVLLVEGKTLVEPVHERIGVYLTMAGWQDIEQTTEMTETMEMVETADMMVVMVMQGQLMMELTEEQALQKRFV